MHFHSFHYPAANSTCGSWNGAWGPCPRTLTRILPLPPMAASVKCCITACMYTIYCLQQRTLICCQSVASSAFSFHCPVVLVSRPANHCQLSAHLKLSTAAWKKHLLRWLENVRMYCLLSIITQMFVSSCIYTPSQKKRHHTRVDNFAKY